MKNFKIQINSKEIFLGGMILWKIEIKERIYNGRIKLGILSFIAIISFFFYPIISYLLIILFIGIIIIDYSINFVEYRNLSKLHKKNQQKHYFLRINDVGFSHTFTEEGEDVFINLWEKYDYIIDVKKRGLFILIDKNGGTNLYFQSWMSNEAFSLLRQTAYDKIRRKLNDRFL